MSAMCGAVLVRVRSPRHGLPRAESALCLVACGDPREAGPALDALGGTVTHVFGWADRAVLAAAGGADAFVRSPGAGRLPLAAAFTLVAANGADASRAWEAWLTIEPIGLAAAVGLSWGSRLDRPMRFIRTRADAEAFLVRNALPCRPLDAEDSVAFRERWRDAHLDPAVRKRREPGKPRGARSSAWTYDWESLARAEDADAEDKEKRPADVFTRLRESRSEETALFFEAADLPVFLIPAAYVGDAERERKWECDVYWTTYPLAGGTAVWDHEGYGPRWSLPRPS